MNHVEARRLWLLYRWDIAAALALVMFMVGSFTAAGLIAYLLRGA